MRTKILFGFFILLILSFEADCTLEQVHVVFRHGDRTPDMTTYPTDPYVNETYYPYGRGQLTLLGIQQEYKLGQNLRNAYDTFLGKMYLKDIIEAICTDYDRTKMSLQAALAGLFPPIACQKFTQTLNWQPIPFSYDKVVSDKVIKNIFVDPDLIEKYNQVLELEEVKLKTENFKWIYQIANENVGQNHFTKPADLFMLYLLLHTQKEMGLLLPRWTNKIFPEALAKVAALDYELRSYTPEMLQLCIGGLFNKIKTDVTKKIEGKSQTKLHLYSAHEYAVVMTLIALDVYQYDPKVPDYGSYVTLELHNINNKYGIKLFYNDYKADVPFPIVMPDCEIFCPIEKFFTLLEQVTTV